MKLRQDMQTRFNNFLKMNIHLWITIAFDVDVVNINMTL